MKTMPGAEGRQYSLALSKAEVARYQLMAERARATVGERLGRAGLELMDFRGTYVIGPVPPGMRQPPWAARDAMVAAGLATEQDVARWARAFDRFDAAATRPTLFAPMFIAVGRRPA